MAICYFRLPLFRTKLLAEVLTEEERTADISEWRGSHFDIDMFSLNLGGDEWAENSECRSILDWDPLHDELAKYFGEDRRELSFPVVKWREKLASRETAFFSFLEQWTRHVHQTVAPRFLALPHSLNAFRWHYVPGYVTLLKAMLLEMKIREVTKYPDSLLNCSGAMLANEDLLTVFVKIVFLKTSVHCSRSVFSSLNYTDYWVQVLSLSRRVLPANFDFAFFRRGMSMLLSSELCLNVAKAIWLLYKNVKVFRAPQLKLLVVDLMSEEYFYRLMLSWSWLIRRCFIWFVLYRIGESTRKILIKCTRSDGGGSQTTGHMLLSDSSTLSCVADEPTRMNAEDKVMLLAYVQVSRYLEALKAPAVLPKASTARKLRALLGPPSKALRAEGLVTACEARPQRIFVRSSSMGSEEDDGDSWMGLPPVPPPEQERVIYVKSALPEFCKELGHYRNWVLRGATRIPPMVIPASPLDQNVDVPLEESW
eukprot:Polyplicarium_translucidae@DN1292_c0_g1_i2.p1